MKLLMRQFSPDDDDRRRINKIVTVTSSHLKKTIYLTRQTLYISYESQTKHKTALIAMEVRFMCKNHAQ